MKKFINELKSQGAYYLAIGFVVLVILALITVAGLSIYNSVTSNKQIWDMTFSFDRAMISLPDGGVVYGDVASWKDFEDGDQIQVKFTTGETYLTHISNVVMISE